MAGQKRDEFLGSAMKRMFDAADVSIQREDGTQVVSTAGPRAAGASSAPAATPDASGVREAPRAGTPALARTDAADPVHQAATAPIARPTPGARPPSAPPAHYVATAIGDDAELPTGKPRLNLAWVWLLPLAALGYALLELLD